MKIFLDLKESKDGCKAFQLNILNYMKSKGIVFSGTGRYFMLKDKILINVTEDIIFAEKEKVILDACEEWNTCKIILDNYENNRKRT